MRARLLAIVIALAASACDYPKLPKLPPDAPPAASDAKPADAAPVDAHL